MANATRIISSFKPDLPRVLSALYRMDTEDRRFLDSQIVGTQTLMAQGLLRGQVGTRFLASVNLSIGDVVCASATASETGDGTDAIRYCTIASAANVAAAGMALGVVLEGAIAGAWVRVALLGIVGRAVTGLVAGAPGLVRVSAAGRCEMVVSFSTGDLPVGYVDAAGNLTVQCERSVSAGGGSGGYTTIKNSAGGAQTQRATLKFGSGFSLADVGSETVVSLNAGGEGGMGFRFTFSTTTTDADPGAGTLRANNATLSSATALFVDLAEYGGTDVTAWLDSLDDTVGAIKGIVRLSSQSDPTKWIEYTLTAWTTATGYRKLTVAYKDGPGGLTTTAGDTFFAFDAYGVAANLGNQSLSSVKHIAYSSEYDNGASGTSKALAFANGEAQTLAVDGNVTLTIAVTAGVCEWMQVRFVQSGGSHTITQPGGMVGTIPTLGATDGDELIVTYFSNGTTLYGSAGGSASAGHVVKSQGGSGLAARTNLDFKAPFTATDNSGADSTDVNLALDGTTLSKSSSGVKLRNGASAGQELFWDGSAWQLIGRTTGTALADASVTLQFTTAAQYFWPASVDSASARVLTLGTTGLSSAPMAGVGAIVNIMFLRTSYTSQISVLNGGAGAGTQFTLPAALGYAVMASFYYDGTNWALAGWEPISVTAA